MHQDAQKGCKQGRKLQLSAVRKAIFSLRLFPKNHDFFAYYQKSSDNILSGTNLLYRMLTNKEERHELLCQLKDCELIGDKITHDVIDLLHHTFLTPFDRTDMHTLIVKMDDVLDFAYYVGNRLTRYDVKETPAEMLSMAEIVCRAAEEISFAVSELRDLKNCKTILARCIKIKDFENQADDKINAMIERIFKSNRDPLEIMKVKELVEHLEGAADKCEDVANIIEGIILRHV